MIITLTTDFGLEDPFAGIMKGVILGIAPDVRLVDITHDVRSYDVLEAAFVLNSAFRYFPPGTIHVAVVDPGVGSARHPMAAVSNGHFFVAPDNGVLSFVLEPDPESGPPSVYRITNESLFNKTVLDSCALSGLHSLRSSSHTFHGRDIFAPVAAHLARGAPVESVGPLVTDFVKQPFPAPRRLDRLDRLDRLAGTVLRIDKFGNIITNLRRADLKPGFKLRIGDASITRVCSTFADGRPGELFVFEGSSGLIEIALNRDSAADKLKVGPGAEIEVETGLAKQ